MSKRTECQEQIEGSLMTLRETLRAASGADETVSTYDRRSLDADICLATRSAHFDFYTWVVLHGVVDGPAAAELGQLFQESLSVMGNSEFRQSVESRYREFQEECENGCDGSVMSAMSSICEEP